MSMVSYSDKAAVDLSRTLPNSYWAKYADIGYYAYAIPVIGENGIVIGNISFDLVGQNLLVGTS